MYRTPDQEEQLDELYCEQGRVRDYAATNQGVDYSKTLAAIEREIEELTTALDVPPAGETACHCPKCDSPYRRTMSAQGAIEYRNEKGSAIRYCVECGLELAALENADKYDFTPAPDFDINWDDVEEIEF